MSPKLFSQQYVSSSEEDTAKIARDFAAKLHMGDAVALYGELGSGKTFFVKKMAEVLGFEGYVSSPTFTILNIYDGSTPLYHFDFYRLMTVEEIEKIGFSELLMEEGMFFVEWPEKAQELFPEEYYTIKIDILDEKKRKISINKITVTEDVLCQS